MEVENIAPQAGPQSAFLETSADIAIYGGAAGGGKSFALLLEPFRHIQNSKFTGIIFRRTYPQIRSGGGMWDEGISLYNLVGARSSQTDLKHVFPSGAALKFGHLEYEKSKYDYQGAQYAFIGFDELCQFTEGQFFYLMSRNRSVSGIAGYIRATCNPDPDSWVRRFIDWWINPDTGLPIKERCGKLRWFIRENDTLKWGDSKNEMFLRYGSQVKPKSLTFIAASIYDNKILMDKDPAYLSNLEALCFVERSQLKDGNWNIRPAAGNIFRKGYFKIVEAVPVGLQYIRFWDRAATEPSPENPDPDYTVGLKLGRSPEGAFYVTDVERDQISAGKVESRITNVAHQDDRACVVGLFQDPGSAGKGEVEYMVKKLVGFQVYIDKITQNKITSARAASSQAEAGNVYILRAPWNNAFLNELEAFPDGKHDDQADPFSASINYFYALEKGSFRGYVSNEQRKDSPRFEPQGERKSVIDRMQKRFGRLSY